MARGPIQLHRLHRLKAGPVWFVEAEGFACNSLKRAALGMSGMEVPAYIVVQNSYCATLLVCIFQNLNLSTVCLGFCMRCLSSTVHTRRI